MHVFHLLETALDAHWPQTGSHPVDIRRISGGYTVDIQRISGGYTVDIRRISTGGFMIFLALSATEKKISGNLIYQP